MSRAEVRERMTRQRQATERLIAARSGRPYPERITTALDLPVGPNGYCPALEGPGVDIACGAVEPAVDRWENGSEVPTRDQVEKLAALTGYPLGFFFAPPGPRILHGIACSIDESGRAGECTVIDRRPNATVIPLFDGTLW